jgi:putative DNA primase/helicase
MSISSNKTTVSTDYTNYAEAIYQAGFNVLPMKPNSKIPDLATWGEFSTRRQTEQEVRAFSWSRNLAIVNGINNIRTIDIDGCDSADVLFNVLQLLGLDFEYQWIVQSPGKGGGFHIYLLCPDALTLTSNAVLVGDPLPDQAFKQVELRWSKCYTMFPPSIHPETNTAYHWLFDVPTTPIAVVPVSVVESAFRSIAVPAQKTKEEIHDQEPKKVIKFDAWALKAQEQELNKVRSAPEGGRNAQLNRSAFALGQIVGSGLLNFEEAQEELTRAALAAGLNEKEIKATIKSGLEAGTKKPRMPKQVYKDNEPAFNLAPVHKIIDDKIASFTADDQGNAEAVFYLYGPYLTFNGEYGWMIWNGTHYVPSIQRVNTLIVEVLRLRLRSAAHLERTDLAKVSKPMAGTVSATRAMLENLALVKIEEFDNEPDLINTLSGIVNLKTKKVIPHDPSYRFTWCAPVRYNPDANGDLWLDFISKTVESVDMIGYLQEALGYSITGHTSEECLFYIYGPPRSGKGTLSETILAIFPRPIAQEVDFNTFTQKREGDNQNFDLAPMKAARLVFASESNKYQSLNPAKVKALTGGNLVSCAFKHRDMFSYRPQYAVWLSSNHEVNADADDDALWGRVKVVSFPNSRLGKEDKSLKRRMQSNENLEAVLAWLVEGAYRWYQLEEKGLQTPEEVKMLTQKQRADQDSIGLWLDECCQLKPNEWTENNKLRTSYENWCTANGYEPKKANSFGRSLAAHGLEVGVKERGVRGVRGLRLLD